VVWVSAPRFAADGSALSQRRKVVPVSTPTLQLRTLGHASIVLGREGEAPLLLTDPWLVGSVYWRSWWLQHYPDAAELDWLAGSAYVYLTHEHPDHFHTPSIRRLGRVPTYLFPALAERGFVGYLAERGHRTEVLKARSWRRLGDGVALLSLPLWNDDSVLVIDTPQALILNLNDAKPAPPVIRALRRLGDRIGKPRIVLASYSPASVVNSFSDPAGETIRLRAPEHYVNYICRLCDRLGADLFIPFASQAVFRRADSEWANHFRTGFADLERKWRAQAELLPPYTTLELAGFQHQSVAPEAYRAAASAVVAARAGERVAAEEEAVLDAEDAAALQRKLNVWRWLLRVVFPRGFAIECGGQGLVYDPRLGEVRLEPAGDYGDFVIAVPTLTMKEALRNDHLTDLGITMFVRIRLLRPLDPRKVYALFVLFQFDDYGHMKNPRAVLRWLWTGLRGTLSLRLPAPR
jgi:hypothetical protein